MFLRNLWCNLRKLLRNFMYFLFLSNLIAKEGGNTTEYP